MFKDTINEIINDFKWYYKKGYITARDGNACFKHKDDYIVTASGIKKHKILQEDFISTKDPKKKLSIETQAHLSALKNTEKNCSIHVHSPNTVALFATKQSKYLEDVINTEWPELFRYTKLGKTVPVLFPGSEELHQAIDKSFLSKPDIIVLKNHGVVSVGESPEECKEHIIRLEHVSQILLKIYSVADRL